MEKQTNILKRGTSWNHLEQAGITWNKLETPRTSWNHLELPGSIWNDMDSVTNEHKNQEIHKNKLCVQYHYPIEIVNSYW